MKAAPGDAGIEILFTYPALKFKEALSFLLVAFRVLLAKICLKKDLE